MSDRPVQDQPEYDGPEYDQPGDDRPDRDLAAMEVTDGGPTPHDDVPADVSSDVLDDVPDALDEPTARLTPGAAPTTPIAPPLSEAVGFAPAADPVPAPPPSPVSSPESSPGPVAAAAGSRRWPGVRVRTVVLGLLLVLIGSRRAFGEWFDLDVDGAVVAVVALSGFGLALLVGAITSGRRRPA
ncbi:MAG: hypothetical protein U0Q15_20615 [Kineosporiaceae bacterium]